jgi:glutamate racemase
MVAIWATVATTGSAYQRNLITEFAASAQVAEVACAGLADAIHAGDEAATRAAVSDAAARTPAGCRAIVLGCTEYELAAGLISAALPGVALFGSATAVAAQALRRATAGQHTTGQGTTGQASIRQEFSTPGGSAGTLQVLLSGRPASLPPAALRYPEGRLVAARPAGPSARRSSPVRS